MLGAYSEIVGQVSLDRSDVKNPEQFGINAPTHKIQKPKTYDVVLYNNYAVRNIHPVSDEILYRFFNNSISLDFKNIYFDNIKDKKEKEKYIELGIDENDTFQFSRFMLNGVSGFVIKCFNFEYLNINLDKEESDDEYDDDDDDISRPNDSDLQSKPSKVSLIIYNLH